MNIYISDIPVNLFELIGLGCMVGFLSGFFGIGGGPLLTPILHIFFGIPLQICIGSNLPRTVGTSFSAVLRYRQFGEVDVKLAAMMIGGNFVGIGIGVHLLDWLHGLGEITAGGRVIPAIRFYLLWIFFVVLLVIAILIIIEAFRSRYGKNEKNRVALFQRLSLPPYVSFPTSGIQRISLFAVVYVPLFLGVLTGLLGIGGGVISVPLLIYGYGVQTHVAIGSSLLLVFFSSSYGTVAHVLRGNVDLRLVALLTVGATICAQFGAMTTRKIGGSSIRFYFAFIVLIVAGVILFDLLRLIYG
jgi:uncharacterized protein